MVSASMLTHEVVGRIHFPEGTGLKVPVPRWIVTRCHSAPCQVAFSIKVSTRGEPEIESSSKE